MENGKVVDAEVAPSVPEGAKDVTPSEKFIAGEIKIVVDGRTGAISVNHPQNIIVALGILETAKAMIIEKQQKLVAQMQEAVLNPKIVRPGPADFSKIRPA